MAQEVVRGMEARNVALQAGLFAGKISLPKRLSPDKRHGGATLESPRPQKQESAHRIVVRLTKMPWNPGLGHVTAPQERVRGVLRLEHNLTIVLFSVPIIWNIIIGEVPPRRDLPRLASFPHCAAVGKRGSAEASEAPPEASEAPP